MRQSVMRFVSSFLMLYGLLLMQMPFISLGIADKKANVGEHFYELAVQHYQQNMNRSSKSASISSQQPFVIAPIQLIRIPKASSTSLSIIARRVAGCNPPGPCCKYPGEPKGTCPDPRLFQCAKDHKVLGCVGHTTDRNFLYNTTITKFSMLRVPILRSLSAYFYPGIHHNSDCIGSQDRCFSEYLTDNRFRDIAVKMFQGHNAYGPLRVAVKSSSSSSSSSSLTESSSLYDPTISKTSATTTPSLMNAIETVTWLLKSQRLFLGLTDLYELSLLLLHYEDHYHQKDSNGNKNKRKQSSSVTVFGKIAPIHEEFVVLSLTATTYVANDTNSLIQQQQNQQNENKGNNNNKMRRVRRNKPAGGGGGGGEGKRRRQERRTKRVLLTSSSISSSPVRVNDNSDYHHFTKMILATAKTAVIASSTAYNNESNDNANMQWFHGLQHQNLYDTFLYRLVLHHICDRLHTTQLWTTSSLVKEYWREKVSGLLPLLQMPPMGQLEHSQSHHHNQSIVNRQRKHTKEEIEYLMLLDKEYPLEWKKCPLTM